MASKTRVTVDHDEIRRWAEARGARPTVVKGTSIIRLDFPGYSGEGKLQPIDWNEFFRRFEEGNLALIYQEKTARGQTSNFNKLRHQGRAAAPPEASGHRKERRPAGRAQRRAAFGQGDHHQAGRHHHQPPLGPPRRA
jgi:hypothetical protein